MSLSNATTILLELPADYPGPFPGPAGDVRRFGDRLHPKCRKLPDGGWRAWGTREEWEVVVWVYGAIFGEGDNNDADKD